jgi:hypothetical protein
MSLFKLERYIFISVIKELSKKFEEEQCSTDFLLGKNASQILATLCKQCCTKDDLINESKFEEFLKRLANVTNCHVGWEHNKITKHGGVDKPCGVEGNLYICSIEKSHSILFNSNAKQIDKDVLDILCGKKESTWEEVNVVGKKKPRIESISNAKGESILRKIYTEYFFQQILNCSALLFAAIEVSTLENLLHQIDIAEGETPRFPSLQSMVSAEGVMKTKGKTKRGRRSGDGTCVLPDAGQVFMEEIEGDSEWYASPASSTTPEIIPAAKGKTNNELLRATTNQS